MMNDREVCWDKRRAAPFADPSARERAVRQMRRDTSRNFNIKGDQPIMKDYRATVSFVAGSWRETTSPRTPTMPHQEAKVTPLVSRQGISRTLAVVLVFACLVAMGFGWLNMQQQIQALSTANDQRTREINSRQEDNQALQTQITLATREQPIRERARSLGMYQANEDDVILLEGMTGERFGLDEQRANTPTITDVAAMMGR